MLHLIFILSRFLIGPVLIMLNFFRVIFLSIPHVQPVFNQWFFGNHFNIALLWIMVFGTQHCLRFYWVVCIFHKSLWTLIIWSYLVGWKSGCYRNQRSFSIQIWPAAGSAHEKCSACHPLQSALGFPDSRRSLLFC